LRIGVVWLQRRLMFGESFRSSLRVALALSPTLIFTLVLAAIMRERFAIPAVLFGALLLYAALTTLLPSLVFRRPLDVDPLQNESDPSADHALHDDAVRDPDAMPGTEQAAVRDA
jgi:Kef-type K+ transport system membrane component KefB